MGIKFNRLAWLIAFVALLGVWHNHAVGAKHSLIGAELPAFTHQDSEDWINSAPLDHRELAGNVLLIDFWTFGCWNCYNSFPWLNQLEKNYANRKFKIIGIHSPEFEHERDREKVVAKTKEFELHHPVMIDNDFSFWRAMQNRYWPAFYLIDKTGVIRGVYVGETHKGDSQSRRIGNLISKLLAEPDSDGTPADEAVSE